MEFTLTLKNEKVKYYRTMRDLVVLLNFFFFIFLLTLADTSIKKITLIAGALLAGVYLLLLIAEKAKRTFISRTGYTIMFALITLIWLFQPYWWVSILLLLLLVQDRLASRRLSIFFTAAHIRFPSVPVRHISWNQLNNVVLKDGLLTMDYKNNKLLQAELSAQEPAPDENYFNDFCNRQLNK